jgi:hypothetical protein
MVENTVSGGSTESPLITCTRWMGALSSYVGIAMVAKIMACPAFLYITKHDAMLIA